MSEKLNFFFYHLLFSFAELSEFYLSRHAHLHVWILGNYSRMLAFKMCWKNLYFSCFCSEKKRTKSYFCNESFFRIYALTKSHILLSNFSHFWITIKYRKNKSTSSLNALFENMIGVTCKINCKQLMYKCYSNNLKKLLKKWLHDLKKE